MSQLGCRIVKLNAIFLEKIITFYLKNNFSSKLIKTACFKDT